MKFSDYIQKQGDEFRRAGDGYEALSDTSKACIDYAVQRFVDEYAAKQQAIAFDVWKIKNHWLWSASDLKYFKWENDDTCETRLSHEEIYTRFIDQQNKP